MDLSAFCQRPMVHSADCMRRTLRVRCTCCQHEAKGLRAAWSASSTAAVRLFGVLNVNVTSQAHACSCWVVAFLTLMCIGFLIANSQLLVLL